MSDRDLVELAKRIVKDATEMYGDDAHMVMHLESSSVLWEIVNALIKERERAERAEKETRTAFDAGFVLGTNYRIGFDGDPEEVAAAKHGERIPTAAACDDFWAKWQRDRAALAAENNMAPDGIAAEREGGEK